MTFMGAMGVWRAEREDCQKFGEASFNIVFSFPRMASPELWQRATMIARDENKKRMTLFTEKGGSGNGRPVGGSLRKENSPWKRFQDPETVRLPV